MSDKANDQDKAAGGTPQDKSLQVSADALFLSQQNAANILRESKERYINEGAKGLIWMNGAGAVALLALLQAIWGKPGAAAFSTWILFGTGCLLFGVALAASIFMLRHRAYVIGAHNGKYPLYRWTHWYVPGFSIAAFVVGAALTVAGGLMHFPPDKPDADAPTKAETVPVKPSPPLEGKKSTPPSSAQQEQSGI